MAIDLKEMKVLVFLSLGGVAEGIRRFYRFRLKRWGLYAGSRSITLISSATRYIFIKNKT